MNSDYGDGVLGALIMLGTLFSLIAIIYALVGRYDPDLSDSRKKNKERDNV